jgi:hypothetical protein
MLLHTFCGVCRIFRVPPFLYNVLDAADQKGHCFKVFICVGGIYVAGWALHYMIIHVHIFSHHSFHSFRFKSNETHLFVHPNKKITHFA